MQHAEQVDGRANKGRGQTPARNVPVQFDLLDFLRSTRPEPSRAGAILSLLLLWSQTPGTKLKGLPSFKDASAEFMLNDPLKVAQALHPDMANEIARPWTELHPSEVENLRRALVNALDMGVSADEIAETLLQYCMSNVRLSKESSEILLAALDAQKGARCRCALSYAVGPAWVLSKQTAVDLDVESHDLAAVVSILAAACGRSLRVRISTIHTVSRQTDAHPDPDHALIIPPIGIRLKLEYPSGQFPDGAFLSQLNTESFGALWGAELGRSRNIVVVGNGLLFRTSSKDAAFKQDLIQKHRLEAVISLPRATLAGSGIAMSALVFAGADRRKDRTPRVRFIDASDPAALGAAALSKLVSDKTQHPLCVDRPFEEISESGFNLSVDRYVLSAEQRESHAILKNQQTVRLSDVADIRRPQALPRDSGTEKRFEIREVMLADIENGRVNLPAKLSELPQSASPKIESDILKPGDILLSIKGTIGKTALVTDDVVAAAAPVPIVPGQSLVILRLRRGSLIRDPQVLVSYLRSPVALSLLRGMAGGTTIQNVAMGALKDMAVPIPSPEAQDKIMTKFAEWQDMQREIDKLRQNMKYIEDNLFSIALSNE